MVPRAAVPATSRQPWIGLAKSGLSAARGPMAASAGQPPGARGARRACEALPAMRIGWSDMALDPIELGIFSSRLEAVCEEMGVVLRNAAFSPNIRDRLDFSCAVFDARAALRPGRAHPGAPGQHGLRDGGPSSPRSTGPRGHGGPERPLPRRDPSAGCDPDRPALRRTTGRPRRGASPSSTAPTTRTSGPTAPGSMPVSRSLHEEGLMIAPVHLIAAGGDPDQAMLAAIVGATRNPAEARGDFFAQIGANRAGIERLRELVEGWGRARYRGVLRDAQRLWRAPGPGALREIPPGSTASRTGWTTTARGTEDIPIRLRSRCGGRGCTWTSRDRGSGPRQHQLPAGGGGRGGALRLPLPDAAPDPGLRGDLPPHRSGGPPGVPAQRPRPAAVAAGNVETSTRVVDVVLGALAQAIPERIPAASHGSMNNLAMGSAIPGPWDYYETIGGGMGAGAARGRLVRGPDPHDQHAQHPHRGAGVALPAARHPLRPAPGSAGAGRGRAATGWSGRSSSSRRPRSPCSPSAGASPPGGSPAAAGRAGVNRLNGAEICRARCRVSGRAGGPADHRRPPAAAAGVRQPKGPTIPILSGGAVPDVRYLW
jgi:N-methylhydantoinase B